MIRESICKKTLCFRSRPNTSQWISTRSQFKRDLVEAIRQSNELFPKSIKEFSQSMLAVASGITNLLKFCYKHYVIKTSKQVHHTYIKALNIFTCKHNIPWYIFLNLRKETQFQPYSFSSVPSFFKCTRFGI